MVFKHLVKHNGKYYPAGTDVPVGGKTVEDKKVVEIKEDDFAQHMNPPEETSEVQYTKTEINRMSTADLKELAKENGIDDGLSGAEIKKALIDKFNL